ncbi:MAG: hypothetical protein ACE5JT_04555, partial [Nitrosopumilaceae archaeon]
MSQRKTMSFVYFTHKETKSRDSDNKIPEEKLQKILQTLTKQALKEKKSSMQDLERILQNAVMQSAIEKKPQNGLEDINEAYGKGNTPITKYLQEKGYLKEGEKWLTNKGFFEIGEKILQDVMKVL